MELRGSTNIFHTHMVGQNLGVCHLCGSIVDTRHVKLRRRWLNSFEIRIQGCQVLLLMTMKMCLQRALRHHYYYFNATGGDRSHCKYFFFLLEIDTSIGCHFPDSPTLTLEPSTCLGLWQLKTTKGIQPLTSGEFQNNMRLQVHYDLNKDFSHNSSISIMHQTPWQHTAVNFLLQFDE